MRRGPLLLASAALALVAVARPALAQSPNDQMLAQSLFDEARTLMDQGRFGEACPKLAESQRLDPGGGTMLNLGICHEREGKLATAYTEMAAALSQAMKDGRRDREAIAREHMAALRPRIPKIAVHVAAPEEGLEVKLDGSVVRRPAWDVPAGVDPGRHVIEAEVPGKKPFRYEIVLREAEERTVEVPSLSAPGARVAGAVPSPAPVETDGSAPARRANPAYYTALAIGATGMLMGTITGLMWLATSDGEGKAQSRETLAIVSAASLSIGAIALGTLLVIPSKVQAAAAPLPGGGAVLTAAVALP